MDVFISYSSAERDEAHYIDSVLRKNGISTWIAPESIPAGSDYTEAIPAGIKQCKVFLLILSKNAQGSKWVTAEVENAFKKERIIIPFSIDNCQLTDRFDFLLSRSQRIEAYEKESEALEHLVNSIKAVLGVDTKVVEVATETGEVAKEESNIKTITYDNGDVYVGEVVDGKPHGKGKMTCANGDVYEGEFKDGMLHKGKATWPNGIVQEGEFKDGMLNGKGKWTAPDIFVYEGDFVEDEFHGYGKMTFADGRVQEGRWENCEFVG